MEALNTSKQLVKQYIDNIKAPTPMWAKILWQAGIVVGATGAAIAAAPALFPAAVVSASAYLIFGGTLCTSIFAAFKK